MDQTSRAAASAPSSLGLIAVFAALTAACSLVTVPLGPGSVPVTLQTFAVLLTGLILGPRRGAAALALYLVVGLAGAPVFAGGRGGLAVLQGASAGYLLAFPAAAAVAGAAFRWRIHRPVAAGVAVTLATAVTYLGGIPVLALRYTHNLADAALYNLAFFPADALKAAAAAAVALGVARAYPALVHGR